MPRTARRAIFLYATVASLWVALSSIAVALLDGRALVSAWPEIAKGLLFVGASSLFLHRLLGPPRDEPERARAPSFRRELWSLAAITGGAAGLGLWLDEGKRGATALALGGSVALIGGLLLLLWRARLVDLTRLAERAESARAATEREAIAEQRQLAARHHATLRSTIEALHRLVELRDPYTSGHQRRVGDLAGEVGRRLGYDSLRVEGLRMAGYVHDVGKVTVPASILTKPGPLTAPESAIVKLHAEQGADILRGLEFPWPLAEIVLQHHEHLDGTGYPRQIRGDALLVEAQIVGAASSLLSSLAHRPFRAAFPLEEGIAQLEAMRGSAYLPAIVDAIVAAVREAPARYVATS